MFIGERFGSYELRECIGQGGMAIVYRARRHGPNGFERSVVVKVLLPDLAREEKYQNMFVEEAKLSALLSHPNIVHIEEFGLQDGFPFIAMESLHGRDLQMILRALIERKKRLPLGLTLLIARELCAALAHAHGFEDEDGQQRPIVHRDISPSNFLICTNGSMKLLDFGVARITSAIGSVVRTNTFCGKFGYMAPEQLENHPVTPRVDVFGVGVILHELLTGARLFAAECEGETIRRLQELEPPPPSSINPEVPMELDALVLKALARKPEQRFASAVEMQEELDAFASRTVRRRELLRFLETELPEIWVASCEGCGRKLVGGRQDRRCGLCQTAALAAISDDSAQYAPVEEAAILSSRREDEDTHVDFPVDLRPTMPRHWMYGTAAAAVLLLILGLMPSSSRPKVEASVLSAPIGQELIALKDNVTTLGPRFVSEGLRTVLAPKKKKRRRLANQRRKFAQSAAYIARTSVDARGRLPWKAN